MDSFRSDASCNKPADESYGVRRSTIYSDILRLFDAFEELHVFGIRGKTLIKIGIINRIDAFNVIFVLVVRRMS